MPRMVKVTVTQTTASGLKPPTQYVYDILDPAGVVLIAPTHQTFTQLPTTPVSFDGVPDGAGYTARVQTKAADGTVLGSASASIPASYTFTIAGTVTVTVG